MIDHGKLEYLSMFRQAAIERHIYHILESSSGLPLGTIGSFETYRSVGNIVVKTHYIVFLSPFKLH